MALASQPKSREVMPEARRERTGNFAQAEREQNMPRERAENAASNRAPDTSELHRAAQAAAVAVPARQEMRRVEIEKILEGDDDTLSTYYGSLSPTGKEKFRLQGEALCQIILGELDRELKVKERRGLQKFMHEILTALVPTRDFRFWTMEQVEGWLTRNGVSRAFAEQHAEIAMQKFVTMLRNERERAHLSS